MGVLGAPGGEPASGGPAVDGVWLTVRPSGTRYAGTDTGSGAVPRCDSDVNRPGGSSGANTRT